ncbi:MAG: outer membrane protein family [Fibrobacteres bacterium]|nr:outer membrane protein family [Fibrobacterota bacterium]
MRAPSHHAAKVPLPVFPAGAISGRSFRMIIALLSILAFPFFAAAAAPTSVDGNDNISKKKIDAVLTVPDKPRELSAEDWEDWVDEAASAITDLYGDAGYLDAAIKIDPPGSDTGKGGDPDRVRIHVREGARYTFGKVAVSNTDHSPSVIDPEDLHSRVGKPFDKDQIFRDRREILNAYGDAGFLHSRSTESVATDTASKTVNLDFLVDAGPAVVFDTLMIRNAREGDSTNAQGVTRKSLLKSLLGLKPGDTVSLSVIGTFERKLKSTRVFNYVRLRDSLLSSQGNRSALILSTEERVPGEADLSVFYETQYGAGIASNWTHGNILGQLHEGRLGGSWAQRKQSVFLGYSSPLFFGTSLRFDNDLITNWYQDSRLQEHADSYEGDFDITNASKISRSFTSWSRGVSATELTGLSERVDSAHTDRSFNLNFINSGFLSFLDDPTNPSRGARWSLTWGNGGSFLNEGEFNVPVSSRHNWLEVETAYYYPLMERIKLAFRLDGGRFFGDGERNSERFFLGGPRSVRSFGWRKVCPEINDTTGVCVKNGIQPAYYLTSFEIRSSPFSPAFINPEGKWKFLLGVQVVPFVDYGRVWDVGEPMTREGEGRAFGLGLRYSLLSIFNLRLDYAVDGLERKHDQWVLDLAQAF